MNVRTPAHLIKSLTFKYKTPDGKTNTFDGVDEIAMLFDWLNHRGEGRRENPRLSQVLTPPVFGVMLLSEGAIRVAPSLVTRSDCELLGACYPRFAYRVYLDEERTIFVNVRRLLDLALQVPNDWTSVFASPRGPAPAAGMDTPRTLVINSSVIADSLLRKRHLEDRYHILTALGLAACMGEPDETGQDGTPYAQSSPIAGHCAQAVCLMASSLLHRPYAKGIFAVAEINALLHDDARQRDGKGANELPLYGLTPRQMERYFNLREVGLGASLQHLDDYRPEYEGKDARFKHCLSSYIKSGFPVVLPVNSGRLAGLEQGGGGIYEANGIAEKLQERAKDSVRNGDDDHSVLIVGCAKGGGVKDFLINDPSCLPFLEATAAELIDACLYEKEEASSPVLKDREILEQALPQWVAVTPAPVIMPLEQVEQEPWTERERDASPSPSPFRHVRRGLLHYADALQAAGGI